MRFIGVIPARYQSFRLPGKALIEIAGKTLVEWVYLRACRSRRLEEVLVATDDQRIFDVVTGFGGKAVMTRSDHLSGTDRVAEVAAAIPADVYLNVQGDEPCIAAETIDGVCEPFLTDAEIQVTTARVAIDSQEAEDPNVNKVVVDVRGRALYFSRARIPYPRRQQPQYYKHVGIYGYRREFLLNLHRLAPSSLEAAEALEQLRFLENGIPIHVVEVQQDSIGVDTPEDLERVRPLLENEQRLTGR